jgi:EAL domain-containing protein (putative c-di-GMP-specific phosphodiesterase class I)
MVGDAVLIKFASVIKKTLRKGEKLYRIGGDEFATLLPNCKPEKVLNVANRCNIAIKEASYESEGIKEPIRAGIGISHTKDNSGDITDILWQADVAVYHAKKPGEANVVSYSKEIKDISSSIFSSEINNIVFSAIEKGENILMHYQPIIDLKTDKIDYYEALLRITNGDQLITPDKVFEIVEAKKLDYELDIQIIKQIENDFKAKKIPVGQGISINISGPSIVHDNILDELSIFIPYLQQHKIILEITETSLITKMKYATDNINKLKKLGFLIALDDFGSGYSSISYLSSMPVDIVKFDITLIKQLNDEKQFRIIKHLAIMIKETGYTLVAEGIETEELNESIKTLGFNYGQGYLYGRPDLL